MERDACVFGTDWQAPPDANCVFYHVASELRVALVKRDDRHKIVHPFLEARTFFKCAELVNVAHDYNIVKYDGPVYYS